MNIDDLGSMSVDELWIFRDEVAAELVRKMSAEKAVLEDRLSRLDQKARAQIAIPLRCRYPKVRPKFVNPDDPSETWAGRGKQPRWLKKQLGSGKRLDELRIAAVAA